MIRKVTVARTFDAPIITNDQSIERVLAAGLPVVFVFMDGAASPALKESMNRLAREQAGQLLVAEVPARDNPASVSRYQIDRLPAVVVVRGGQVVSKAGGISATELDRHVAFLLGKGPRPVGSTRRRERAPLCRDRCDVRARRSALAAAGAGRFLGALVRPMPHRRAGD
jgi:hypothetical protein